MCSKMHNVSLYGCRMEMQEAKKIADMKKREKMEEKLARSDILYISPHQVWKAPSYLVCGVRCAQYVFLKVRCVVVSQAEGEG